MLEEFSPDEKKTLLGFRISALVEIVLFLTLMVGLNSLFGSGDRFLGVQPHPFWVIVLLVTVQYGTYEGLAAAFFSTVFLYAGNLPPIPFNETLFEYRVQVATLPVLWFIAATILGELRMRIEFELDKFREIANQAVVTTNEIADAYEVLKTKKETIEVKLAGHLRSISTTYNALRNLESMNPGQILLSLNEFVKEIIGPKKFSIYSFSEAGFEAVVCEGWEAKDDYQRRFSIEHPLTKELCTKKSLVCVVNQNDEIILGGEGVLACPIMDHKSTELFGMLKIEDIPFSEINISNLQVCEMICSLIGATFSNAQRYEYLARNSIYTSSDETTFSYALYKLHKDIVKNYTLKKNNAASQIDIRLVDNNKDKSNFVESCRQLVVFILQQLLPHGATIYQAGRDEVHFLVLLPLNSIESEKLVQEFLYATDKEDELKQFTFTIQIEDLHSKKLEDVVEESREYGK